MSKKDIRVDMGDPSGPKVVKMEFPSNSHKQVKKEKEVLDKNITKITSGRVVTKKKSLGKKFKETFLGDNVDSVSSYLLHDVLIPAAKNMMSDTVSSGIEMLLFGETKSKNTRRDKGKSYTSYSNYYKEKDRGTSSRTISNRGRVSHNFDDVILESRGEAEEVLSHLVDLTVDYGMASVADLYDLVGITSNFTDNKYGWDNLSEASVSRVRDGYVINLPKAIILE